ncbi:Fur family transcriptional regulator [Pseudobacteroides cellulosolvens]|uniref:Ferric uptake regulator, Fur family n=1 Tax=Pseudobacteroides cellulosolvens ATCC 35603 = DSM 2933 TaxID=398512 RepID=A0A0L6JY74_9FIRM|nr:Fur family transcriptional regulator [Pseudobacteroides cellulosolvens]KNY30412.1 ferric uptake regulator, Fur family [Pseudobacteroides cellulosolvens ATCC 35603 = DSM 2933]
MDTNPINLSSLLKEKGCKLTPQRQTILDIIMNCREKHLSAEEIHDLVKRSNPDIGLATVYRTMLLFNEIGIVHKLDLDDGLGRYELNRHESSHRHHHLICTSCNTVIEVEQDLLESLEQQILLEHGFIVRDHRVKFYGTCSSCADRSL